jgi:uncharacterized membrane protein
MFALETAIRVLHIGSAIALLGGTLFFLVVMIPSLKVMDEGLRASILQVARKRFYRISHPALLLLLLTGLYRFITDLPTYPRSVHPLIGTKILLAVSILFIVFGQTFGVIKGCPIKWARVNLTLGVLIVILAAIVRGLRLAGTT